ncbi:MAG TPA: multiheme c-type cytochrome [Leptospiraceae bacterium]|nr:multiheme c-type cytochrome [Leptospiraceae bacterium]HMW04774.1 multiheme c-type cytochrome [Leptospiraceae bacterium]HMY33052.1 multiheme c-type cytochrome [Leptospiraceae bacterium]HMZ65527.1 multiheme c-type cytochrome [Leptospiraceae bacterium]HNA09149.1 multiheme c-type cytochrome [Leptospiraceae bacterium]
MRIHLVSYIGFTLLAALFLTQCKQKNIHGFNKGLTAIEVESDIESSKQCQKCHKEIYREWETSRHKVAFTNDLYRESHRREPLVWCVNCHAPLLKSGGNLENLGDRVFIEEGVSCIVCHKRGDKILTAHVPQNPKEHSYLEVKSMKKSEFCENCHQFNFPTGTGKVPHREFKFSRQPMQNTFNEWQMSYFYGKENCQDCHMQTISDYRTHTFPGGHSKDYLERTFSLQLYKIEETEIKIILEAKRLGHAFPTGDLFRTLVIKLYDKDNLEIRKILLRYEYEEMEANKNSQTDSAKKLKSRSIITPPVLKENAYFIKNIKMEKNETDRIRFYELSMQYVNESNELFQDSNETENALPFKKETIKVLSQDQLQ